MTPQQFAKKWKASTLKERSGAQEHFIDLCRLLDEPTPAEADPTGSWYGFERGAKKTGGAGGWADVWRRGCFAWEYKGKHKDLDTAFAQLQRYAIALENPPLLVVSAARDPSGFQRGEDAGLDIRSVMRSPGTFPHLFPAPRPGPARLRAD